MSLNFNQRSYTRILLLSLFNLKYFMLLILHSKISLTHEHLVKNGINFIKNIISCGDIGNWLTHLR